MFISRFIQANYFKKYLAENAVNTISEPLDFKIFWGGMLCRETPLQTRASGARFQPSPQLRNTRDHSSSTIRTETLCDLIRMILTMNIFEFNNNCYIQKHGTAMGTRMAPSYANLFLAKFGTDALMHAPHQPHTWWRFIDDIFMIRTHTENDLLNFISYLNNLHPTIIYIYLFS